MADVIIKTMLTEVSQGKKGVGIKLAGLKLVIGKVSDLMSMVESEAEVFITIRPAPAEADLFEGQAANAGEQ